MHKVVIYKAEGTVENPTILGVHKDFGKFDELSTALFVANQEIKLSAKNGADIEEKDGDIFWINESNRIDYCLKIEQV